MRTFALALTSLAFVSLSVSANATFLVIDDDLVYDTSNNLYFQRNYLAYSGLSYNETISAIDNSTVGGFTDWSLATRDQIYHSSFYEYEHLELDPLDLAGFFQPNPDYYIALPNMYYWGEGLIDELTPETTYSDYQLHTFEVTGVDWGGPGHYAWDTMFPTRFVNASDLNAPAPFGAWVVSSGSSPVPEPTTMLVFGTGLVGLVVARLRKKEK